MGADSVSSGRTRDFESRLGHVFSKRDLLTLALTHRSRGPANNERLEFLGDSLLNFIVAEELYQRFPEHREGELSRLRASLVRRETLSVIARDLALGDMLSLGTGEAKSGGAQRDSILADTVEALVAGIYLDAGIKPATKTVLGWYRQRLAELNPRQSHKDAKTELQEFLQARRLPLPSYEIAAKSGEAHAHSFCVHCVVAGLPGPVQGHGPSRRIAEQQSAQQALQQLQVRETRDE